MTPAPRPYRSPSRRPRTPAPRRGRIGLLALSLLLSVSACGGGGSATAAPAGPAAELRLGYFANVTHAAALHGVATGGFQRALGATRLRTTAFTAGPAAVEALRSGGLDAAFLGPNPAVNGFAQTKGKLLRIVAGTTSGGAALVVRPGITSVRQLEGERVATPQLGNTQDIAARAHFAEQGVRVRIVNQDNAQTLELLKDGAVAGGWVPEPWASRLVLDGGGQVLVDEASLWPGGRFVTTHLVVRTEFLQRHRETVEALLRGLLAATDAVATETPAVQRVVDEQLLADTGKRLAPEVLASSFRSLTATVDPVATSLAQSAKDAEAVGLLRPVDLRGIYDLSLLNALLVASGRPAVSDAGLGATT